MGEWDGNPQASQFAPTPRGLEALFQRLERVERLLAALTGANILSAADVFASKNGLTIASELLVTGATRIEGTLSLPAGIIDNDALANPVKPERFGGVGNSFGVNGWTTVASAAVTVPDGFTKCVVAATGFYRAQNNSTAGGYLAGRVLINGTPGEQSSKQVSAGLGQQDTATADALLSGLASGQTIPVTVQVYFPVTLSADANNTARVSGTLMWFR